MEKMVLSPLSPKRGRRNSPRWDFKPYLLGQIQKQIRGRKKNEKH